MSEEDQKEDQKAVINLLKTLVEQTKPKVEGSGTSSEVHHVFDPNCPTCKPKIDAYVAPLLEKSKEDLIKILKERANLPYECEGDGCGVTKEEKECPLCHGTKARKR